MSFARYPQYKHSGVEWLGQVPAHWNVIPLKFIANVQTGVAKGKDNSLQETILVPYLRVANVQDGYLDLDTIAEIEIPVDDLPRYQLQKGDVLMNEGGDFDKLGRGHIWDASIEPCIHQNHVFAVRPHGVSPVWLNLITGSQYAQFYFMTRSKQSTNLASISSTNLMELPVVLPPTTEQTQIAAFLDRETAKIDGLVAEQRRLMALLKEKRQAVISHAVTRGLNPDVPMKPSGIEWLGDVPAHWGMVPLAMLANMIQTGPFGSQLHSAEYVDNGTPVINPSNIQNGKLTPDWSCSITPENVERLLQHKLIAGDIVFGRRGEMGRCALVSANEAGWVCGTGSLNVRLSDRADPLFVSIYLRTEYVREWLKLQSVGSTMDNLNTGILGSISVPVPPLDEQTSVAAFLETESAKFDTLTAEAQRAIALLQERRIALISAAVTGQIDVRSAVTSA
jgi:type I restriction enzyme S subunit